ncbi:MAG: glycosyltransferase family 2 protein [Cruoricaptor ignavus]|nr:glycosyltransferase family 2 protein [Cruoricaptor ignavus]
MLFSILIAHYNNYDYFLDCYKSILAQTYQNFEVIIVDDCSTDNSYEKLQELLKSDNRFRLYRNEENKGVGYTKRRCVELANGDICGFVDPDDAITKNAIQSVLSNYDGQTSAVYSRLKLCDNQLHFIKLFPNQKQVPNNNAKFLNVFFEMNHFFTFKKTAYEKTVGIDASLTSAVDQDLYLKIYETGKCKFINEANYLYRLHDKGVSQEKSKKEKLNKNWHIVLKNTLERREIAKIYGKNVSDIENLPKLIFEKENTLLKKILRKFL